MFDEFNRLFALGLSAEQFVQKQPNADQSLAQEIFEFTVEQARKRYEERKTRFGAGRSAAR